jgi:UDP-N-acetylglucosamine--N-acetylmuramyl-(pentapeptide) pyrophosphoryl-undecaprenol N-acetylglucosamine transferase
VTVVFAGGGTGGHLYPAIAIADALRLRNARIAFVGTADRLEASIVPKAGYELHTIASRQLRRRVSLDTLATVAANIKGTLQSLKLLAAARPDLVVATGGYVCFPLALAARIRRMLRLSRALIVLLEPNAAPGLTTRLLAPIVDEIWGGIPGGQTRMPAKYRHTGIPIRSSLRSLPPRDAALARLGFDPARATLVAMGGSQGARTINDALLAAVASDGIPDGWQLLMVTGEGEYDRVNAALPANPAAPGSTPVRAVPYLDDMADAYAAADLLVARAGASTLGELAALGKPAILVPYPYAAEGHQALNAARFESAGAAAVTTDREIEAGGFSALLARTANPQRLAELTDGARRLQRGDALEEILARIDALVPRKSRP